MSDWRTEGILRSMIIRFDRSKIMKTTLVLLIIACNLLSSSAMYQDTPYTPKGKGSSVVAQVSSMIEASGIFPSDNQFLCRVAWVESKYGTARGTYRPGYYGGIWQVDNIGYTDTKRLTSLSKYRDAINNHFKINWKNTEWQDLTKPLYSGLAARLFLAKIPTPIPRSSDIFGQARYWKKYYNTAAGKGTVEKFVDDVRSATGCASVY